MVTKSLGRSNVIGPQNENEFEHEITFMVRRNYDFVNFAISSFMSTHHRRGYLFGEKNYCFYQYQITLYVFISWPLGLRNFRI